MKIEEKIKKNREVFQDSPFFSQPRESISREIAEPFLEITQSEQSAGRER